MHSEVTKRAERALLARITGESMMAKNTGARDGIRPTQAEIARLAYSFYEQRGRRDGHDVSDWILAESELRRHFR
jgi:hypothetical protein